MGGVPLILYQLIIYINRINLENINMWYIILTAFITSGISLIIWPWTKKYYNHKYQIPKLIITSNIDENKANKNTIKFKLIGPDVTLMKYKHPKLDKWTFKQFNDDVVEFKFNSVINSGKGRGLEMDKEYDLHLTYITALNKIKTRELKLEIRNNVIRKKQEFIKNNPNADKSEFYNIYLLNEINFYQNDYYDILLNGKSLKF